jgi:hypothetical protein
LYSTVNRRVAFATTSIADPPRVRSTVLIGLQSLLALDSKLPGGHCLTHIDREGGGSSYRSAGATSGLTKTLPAAPRPAARSGRDREDAVARPIIRASG